jgi:hypothetical protein
VTFFGEGLPRLACPRATPLDKSPLTLIRSDKAVS